MALRSTCEPYFRGMVGGPLSRQHSAVYKEQASQQIRAMTCGSGASAAQQLDDYPYGGGAAWFSDPSAVAAALDALAAARFDSDS